MIDYLFNFADQATAQNDSVVGAYCYGTMWRSDCCIPNVQVWNAAQDTTTQTTGWTNAAVNTVTHVYQSGWWILIRQADAVPALDDHSALMLKTDASNSNAVLASGATWNSAYSFQPKFM